MTLFKFTSSLFLYFALFWLYDIFSLLNKETVVNLHKWIRKKSTLGKVKGILYSCECNGVNVSWSVVVRIESLSVSQYVDLKKKFFSIKEPTRVV